MRSWLPLLLLHLAPCCLLAHMHVPEAARTHVKRATNCGANKFQCKNGACVNKESVCDGIRDCTDGSDEDTDPCIDVLMPVITNVIANDVLHTPLACPAEKYQCPTGECINAEQKCDRRSDCPDGADERLPECKSAVIGCNTNEFQCKSGSCVPSSSICNRIRDCNDGSDEANDLCGRSREPCSYPPTIEHGTYLVLGCEQCTPVPGEPMQEGANYLQYACDPGYQLKGFLVRFCSNGKWNANAPTCEEIRCPSLTSESIAADCYQDESRFTCNVPVVPGTTADVRCKSYYTSKGALYQTLTCGADGRWNDVTMKCYPACGQDRSANIPLIANGTVVKGGDFPWHVGIYKYVRDVYVNICGASLISPSYVLSAAHCFWHNGKTDPVDLFRLIAGKFHRSYNIEDPLQQERKIAAIDIPISYLGSSSNYHDDIAVLKVDSPFRMTDMVRPVCVDWDDNKDIAAGDKGHVAGWGLTESGDRSDELLSAELPIIDFRECLRRVRPGQEKYYGSDKICAEPIKGTTVCTGDSGGGLTFIYELNPFGASSKRYFVQGVVSTAPSTGSGRCNLKDIVAFTKVQKFLSFLRKYKEY